MKCSFFKPFGLLFSDAASFLFFCVFDRFCLVYFQKFIFLFLFLLRLILFFLVKIFILLRFYSHGHHFIYTFAPLQFDDQFFNSLEGC